MNFLFYLSSFLLSFFLGRAREELKVCWSYGNWGWDWGRGLSYFLG